MINAITAMIASVRVNTSRLATASKTAFGVDITLPLDGGGVVVGDKISVELEIEAVLRAA